MKKATAMHNKSLNILFAAALLAFGASTAHAQAFDAVAVISSTMGVNANRLCMGEGTRGDLGCPTYAPSVSSTGALNVSGSLRVANSSATCDASTAGSVRWNGTQFQTCFGSGGWATLTSAGVSGTIGNQVAFSVHKNGSTQTVVANNPEKLTWSTEVFDTNNNFASDRFTPTVPGYYYLNVGVYCADSTAFCEARINKNGTLYQYMQNRTGSNSMVGVSAVVYMNGAGDYAEAWVYNSAGTTINGGANITYFQGALISARGADGAGGASSLSGLSDVTLSSPASGQALIYNGSSWTNSSSGLSSDRLVSGSAVTLLGPSGTLMVRGMLDIVTGTGSTHLGNGAGFNSTANYLTAAGYNAAYNNIGTNVTAIGVNTGSGNAGNFLTAVGQAAAYINSGSHVTAVGYLAGAYNSANYLTAVGINAGAYNQGANTTAVGYAAALNNVGPYGTFVGYGAGLHNSATMVTAVGYYAGQYLAGGYNTLLGGYAGRGTSTAVQTVTGSTIAGYASGYKLTTGGDYNSIFGYAGGYELTTGGYNTLLGYRAGDNITTGSSNIIIGSSVNAPVATASNQLNIGNAIYGNLSTGNVGIGTSSPVAPLDVAHTGSKNEALRLGDPDTPGNVTGIYLRTTDTGKISVGSGGNIGFYHGGPGIVETMRINSSGNVGIGTPSPVFKLHISGTTTTDDGIRIDLNNSNNALSAYAAGSVITHNLYSSGNNGILAIHGGGVETIRLNSAGQSFMNALSIGTSAPYTSPFASYSAGWAGEFYTSAGSNSGQAVAMRRNTVGYYSIFYYNGWAASTGGIYTTDGTTTLYSTSSDYRLKEEIQSIEGASALSKIMMLKPVSYHMVSSTTGSRQDGFLAHEVQAIAPYAVTGTKDEVDEKGKPVYQAMDYGKLTPLLTAAVQELKTENDALKAELATQKARSDALEARLKALESK